MLVRVWKWWPMMASMTARSKAWPGNSLEKLQKLFFGQAGTPDLRPQQERGHLTMQRNDEWWRARFLKRHVAALGFACSKPSPFESLYCLPA